MRRKILKNAELLQENSRSTIIEESRRAFQKAGFSEDDDADFTGLAENILDDYSAHFGAGRRSTTLSANVLAELS